MFQYQAVIREVIDGDTLKIDLDLGFYIHHKVTVRLARINTPETVNYSAQGLVDPAKNFILANCPVGSSCVVGITRQEKYGRWLAELLFQPGVTDALEILRNPRVLNDELVRSGLAKPYSGGKK